MTDLSDAFERAVRQVSEQENGAKEFVCRHALFAGIPLRRLRVEERHNDWRLMWDALDDAPVMIGRVRTMFEGTKIRVLMEVVS